MSGFTLPPIPTEAPSPIGSESTSSFFRTPTAFDFSREGVGLTPTPPPPPPPSSSEETVPKKPGPLESGLRLEDPSAGIVPLTAGEQAMTLEQMERIWQNQGDNPGNDPQDTIKQTLVFCRLLDQGRACSMQKTFANALKNLNISKSSLAARLVNTGWTTVFNRRLQDKKMIAKVFEGVGRLISQDREVNVLIYVRSLRLPDSFIQATKAQGGLADAMIALKNARPLEWRNYWISLQVRANVIASNRWIVFGGIGYLDTSSGTPSIRDQQAVNKEDDGIEYVIGGQFGLQRSQPLVELLLHEFLTVGAEIFIFKQQGGNFRMEDRFVGDKVKETTAEIGATEIGPIVGVPSTQTLQSPLFFGQQSPAFFSLAPLGTPGRIG